jgi:hypothetical protein
MLHRNDVNACLDESCGKAVAQVMEPDLREISDFHSPLEAFLQVKQSAVLFSVAWENIERSFASLEFRENRMSHSVEGYAAIS